MQENLKQLKRSKTLSTIAICLLLVLFTASIVLAVIAPVFTSNGVASAYVVTLPESGFVGHNLLYNSDFSITGSDINSWSSRGSSVLTVDGWYLFNGDASYSSSVPRINFDSTQVGSVYSRFYSKNFTLPAGTYTITGCYNYVSGGGTSRLRINNAHASSFDDFTGDVYVNLDRSSGVHISSFVITLGKAYDVNIDYYSSAPAAGFIADLYWVKVEVGSTFTGYVPDYQNTIDSQKELVANYNFYSRFITPVKTPSRKVYFNLNTYPVIPPASFFKSAGSSNQWMYCDYFEAYNLDGGWYAGNNVVTVGWELYYRRLGTPQDFTTDYTSAVLKCNGTKIFSYDCSGDNINTLTLSNPKWFVSANITTDKLSIYLYDFSGASPYFTLSETSALISEQFSNSCWGYSFALHDMNNWSDLSNDVYYNNGYNEGFKGGKSEGYSTGLDEGYSNGFAEGKTNGYDIGYNEGVNAGQDYSFSALFGAVFDVPIQAFKGLFNFEIFGVNMTSFVSSLLALCVIVVIVKICLGGK